MGNTGLRAAPLGADFTGTRVKIRKDNAGAPGDLVANLLNPASFSAGILSFAAPANTTLEAGETYWVVINEGYNSTSVRMDFDTTSSDDQTVTTADPNWSIADTRLWKNMDTASWESPSARAVMLAVNGTAAGDTPPPLSTDATLSALSLGTGVTLDPIFAPGTTSYTAAVGNAVDEVTVTPTTTDTNATPEFLDASDTTLDDADGVPANGQQVALAVGDTVFKVQVTAEGDTTTQTYAVTVTRAAADTPTCTLNTGDLWCGIVEVEAIEVSGSTFAYGFSDPIDQGDLSDKMFSVVTDGVTTPYTINGVFTGIDITAGVLSFSLTSSLTAADQATLVLHVDGRSDPFAFSAAIGPTTSFAYQWHGTGLDWSSESSVTLRLRGETVPTSCTLNPGDLWCGVVTVGVYSPGGTLVGHGFASVAGSPVIGALSDPGFSVVTNGVTTPYTIDSVFTGVGTNVGSLFFSLTSAALTAADQAKLVLHVDGRSDPFAFRGVTPSAAFHTYQWTGRGLDWCSWWQER